MRPHYDLHIVCDPDVPYEEDPQRFLPLLEDRMNFHAKLIQELNKRAFPYVVVSGTLEERKNRCIQLVEQLLGT
jgi:HTH-type transcriptional repressor of NAD biosynthesis genes